MDHGHHVPLPYQLLIVVMVDLNSELVLHVGGGGFWRSFGNAEDQVGAVL